MPSGNTLSAEMLKELKNFLKKNKRTDLLSVYLRYVERIHDVRPVLFPGTKTIYKSIESAIELLQKEGKVWREPEVKITYEKGKVNENTKKVYICPYSGKVFGDNTHPNPQDAIYEWVAKCPQNSDRVGGVKAKRFFVSDDPEVIKSYISKNKRSLTKKVFSSQTNNKLYHSLEALLEEFKRSYLKPVSLFEVQNQTRFTIHADLMTFLQEHICEQAVSDFVESLTADPELKSFVSLWVEEEQEK
ncbi:DUF2709 domain-containing protein [Candidatus Similichlamydia epinepheli]|uniref:DUF2709 domain-containing protein n=1 Tax=Candidatus Similichlamydia epinepheli TaxID=1903953 RepID=UPI000D38BE90|nr:DUF2709 domain-containing protein [Candidatus Similichlamydia epinepheli]